MLKDKRVTTVTIIPSFNISFATITSIILLILIIIPALSTAPANAVFNSNASNYLSNLISTLTLTIILPMSIYLHRNIDSRNIRIGYVKVQNILSTN